MILTANDKYFVVKHYSTKENHGQKAHSPHYTETRRGIE